MAVGLRADDRVLVSANLDGPCEISWFETDAVDQVPKQMNSNVTLGKLFLENVSAQFKAQKTLAENAVAQVQDDDLRRSLDEHTNSIAVIMKHMAGNMRSRWTDFLTTDGEKLDRNRDDEFVDDFESRAALQNY